MNNRLLPLLLIFLFAGSLHSQVNIKVNRGDHISVIDTLNFEISFEKLLERYSLDAVYYWRVKTTDGTNVSYSIVYSFRTE